MGRTIRPVVPSGTLADREQPVLAVDDELALRPFRPEDAAAVVAAFTTPDIVYFHARRIEGAAEARAWIADVQAGWRLERAATWAVVERAGDAVLGRVTVSVALAQGQAEISYWVLPAGRGRRVATRACIAATRWAHGIGIHRVQLEHSPGNEASRRVALASGYVEEGVRRGATLHVDGFHDMVVHSHLPGDGPAGG